MIEIVNGPNHDRYRVVKKVAKFRHCHVYLCEQVETGRQCLLQIATAIKDNGDLQRAAYILGELTLHADKLEEEYVDVKTDPNVFLNYKFGFPELVDSFICSEQKWLGLQVNILAFRNVENVADMVPLVKITAKDHLRIDLRTSAWIMGKILKLLDFAYGQGISVDQVTGENILINPEKHYVLFFDWSKARISEAVPNGVQLREIATAARAVFISLGGDVKTGIFPEDGNEAYVKYLLKLVRGEIGDAGKAHHDFYEIVDETWKREFYPFTVEPLRQNTTDSYIEE